MADAPFTDHEPMTRSELAMVAKALGPIQTMVCKIGEIDLTRGKAKTKQGRCFWTNDGRRISIESLGGGGYVAGVDREPDPEAPRAGTFLDKK